MSETWPDAVPYQAKINTVRGERPFVAPYRTTFEDGNKRARRSTTKNIATIAFTLVPLTGEQFKAFAKWVRDDLVDGTLPFTMKVWTGTSYEDRSCRFAEDYQWQDVGYQLVEVSLMLEVDNYIVVSEPET